MKKLFLARFGSLKHLNTLILDEDTGIRIVVLSNPLINDDLLKIAMRDSESRIREISNNIHKTTCTTKANQ